MTFKSVLDIQINDQQFAAFSEKFTKYSEMLAKTPDAWAGVNKEMKTSFESVAAALLAHKELTDEAERSQQNLEDSSHRVSKFWSDTAKSAKSVAGSIKDGAASLLKWTAAGTIFSGLLGVGSLFGLDALAGSVGNTRRTSLGLGTTYGEQKAFGLNFDRVIDSDAVLGGVNTALHDAQQRSALYGAGLTQSDIVGKDTAQVSVALLSKVKTLVDQTDPTLLGQLQSSRKLDTLGFSLETLERLRATPRGELNEYSRSYEHDRTQLGLDPVRQKAWQSFQVQLDRAGQKIENVFVDSLGRAHVPEALDKLSDAFSTAIQTLVKSPEVGKMLDSLAGGIKGFASYMADGKLEKDLKEFGTNVGLAAEGVVRALKWLGVLPRTQEEKDKHYDDSVDAALERQYLKTHDPAHKVSPFVGEHDSPPSPRNNPGNLRSWKGYPTEHGFAKFPSADVGIRAMGAQLRLYGSRDHLDTLRQIISKYAPESDHNDTDAYVRDVSSKTGFKPDQRLNLNDKSQLAALIAAMTKHENRKTSYTPQMILKIFDTTGGNVNYAAAQLPR